MKSEIDKLLDSLREFKSGDEAVKSESVPNLVESLTSDFLFENVKNYSDVCHLLNEAPETCPYRKIKQIEKLFNGGWIKDWSDGGQRKWYPYFETKASSLVFYYSDCNYGGFDGRVAYYKDEETSNFCGRTFLDVYEALSK